MPGSISSMPLNSSSISLWVREEPRPSEIGRTAAQPLVARFLRQTGWVYRQRIDSSVIVSVGYDRNRRVLEVELVGGAVYQYLDVPAKEYMALLAAESQGRFYNQRIKPSYEYRQVT